jgi:ELWxxDGT repeat protein
MKKICLFICGLFVSCSIFPQTPELLLDINPNGNSVTQRIAIYNFNGTGYFAADDGVHGTELWQTDGSTQGTSFVKDLREGAEGSVPHAFCALNNKLLFGANDNSGYEELWISDGTAQGTVPLKTISTDLTKPSYINSITSMGNQAFFIADDGIHGSELWITDGTTAGTRMVKDIEPTANVGALFSSSMPTVLDNKIYFKAKESVYGCELWVSDGTEAGTILVKDINPGTANGFYPGSSPVFTVMNGKLYFRGIDAAHGDELWVTDGTEAGTYMVKDINPGAAFSMGWEIYPFNNKLYFNAYNGDPAIGWELWSSDGTADGTQLFKDINTNTNPGGSNERSFCEYNGKLYFFGEYEIGSDGLVHQLWVTNGTAAGTVPVAELPANNYSSNIILYNGDLYFTNDCQDGSQMFRYGEGDTALEMVSPAAITPDGCAVGILPTTAYSIINGSLLFPAQYDVDKGGEFYKITTPATGLVSNGKANPISLYPNPADKQVKIRMENGLSWVQVFNQQGQIVFQRTGIIQPEFVYNCSSLNPGIYLVKIGKGSQATCRKLVVRH